MAIYIDDYRDKAVGSLRNTGNLRVVSTGSGKTQNIVSKNGQHVLRFSSTQANQLFVADTRFTNNIDDVNMLVCFSVDAVQQVPGSYGIINWDYTAENKGLSLALLPARGVKALQLYDDSVQKTVAFANYDWQNGQKYWIRWKVVGGNQHAIKIWRDGVLEPNDWTFTVTYANRTVGMHYIGYGTYGPNHTVEYNFFSVGTNGDTPPASVAEYITRLQPSTPVGVFSSGYGGMAFGSEFRPAFTVNELMQHGNANIQSTRNLDVIGNTRIAHIQSKQQIGNSRVQQTSVLTQNGNACIQHISHITQIGSARIGRVQQVNQAGSAVVESFHVANTINQSGNANIKNDRVLSILGSAVIGSIGLLHQNGNSVITHNRKIDQNGSSLVEYQQNISQNGRIFVIIQPNIVQTGNIRIAKTGNVTQIGSVRISNPTPDKLPQNWRNSDEKQPKNWQNTPRIEQNWRNSDTRKETDWQRQYYD